MRKNTVANVYTDCDDGNSVAVRINGGHIFYIDKVDEPLIRQHHWFVGALTHGYPQIENRHRVQLPWLITGRGKGLEVDHIDHDRFNNRRSNLRVCTHRQNQCNQDLQKNNTSGYAGVRFYAARGKYTARIKYFQRDVHLGYYLDVLTAVRARNAAQWYLFGEYGIYPEVGQAPTILLDYIQCKCAKVIDRLGALLPEQEIEGIVQRMGIDLRNVDRKSTNPFDGICTLMMAKGA